MDVDDYIPSAISIEAEVVPAVYGAGIGISPSQTVANSCAEGGSFSSSRSPSQPGTPSLPPQVGGPRLRTTIDLTVYTAEVKVELDEELSGKIFRSIKKQPPSRLQYSMVFVSTLSHLILHKLSLSM